MSKDLEYIDKETHSRLINEYTEVAKMLNSMINNPEKILLLNIR